MQKLTILVLLLISFFSCSNNGKEINIDLSDLNAGSIFCLDTINKTDWDSLYILNPYSKIDAEDLKIPESSLKKIESQSMTDGCCTLLFFKHKKLVNYAFIPRNIADYSQTDGKLIFPSTQKYELNDERIIIIL